MSTINKIGLVIVFLILISGIAYLAKGGFPDLSTVQTPDPTDVGQAIAADGNSDIQAKTEYLSQMREEYEASTDDTLKATLRTLILHEAERVDTTKLPADLQRFIAGLKKEE